MRKAKSTPKKQVTVAIDANLEKLWGVSVKVLEHAKREGVDAYDTYWEAVAAIIEHNPPLFLAGGISTESDFLARYVSENRTAAYHHMKVARLASPSDEAAYGTSKLLAVIGYLEARAGAPVKAPVDFPRVRIPVVRDGAARQVPIDDATVAEIREAQRVVQHKEKSSRRASPMTIALEKLVRSVGLKATQVRVSRDVVTLQVPVAKLGTLGAALTKFKPPK